jgi:hypothetical protein
MTVGEIERMANFVHLKQDRCAPLIVEDRQSTVVVGISDLRVCASGKGTRWQTINHVIGELVGVVRSEYCIELFRNGIPHNGSSLRNTDRRKFKVNRRNSIGNFHISAALP